MTVFRAAAAAAVMVCAATSGWAQTLPPPQNVVSLSVSATAEVTKDVLGIVFATTREGTDAGVVQSQLKQAVDAALAEARKVAKPGQVDVQTGNFALYPRYSPKGGINGWQGSAELAVEGRDIAAISQLSGRIQTLSVSRVAFSLSREAREKVEADVTAEAIARFQSRAEAVSRRFGFAGYSIREVSVSSNEPQGGPVPMFRAQAAGRAMADEALPVEAGKAGVTVSVSGSVQMSPR